MFHFNIPNTYHHLAAGALYSSTVNESIVLRLRFTMSFFIFVMKKRSLSISKCVSQNIARYCIY